MGVAVAPFDPARVGGDAERRMFLKDKYQIELELFDCAPDHNGQSPAI